MSLFVEVPDSLIAVAPQIERCRVCGNPNLVDCLDMGPQYLSSIFPDDLSYRKKLLRYPLDMVLCEKKNSLQCGLVQLKHELDLSGMYKEYPYTSGSNSSMKAILKDVADSGAAFDHLRSGDLVLDIGANDGTLLSNFQGRSLDLLGIDAAQNIQPVFQSPQFKLVRGFFSKGLYQKSVSKKAKLIFSIAMFYHLSNPVKFSQDVAEVMEDEGVWIIQMAYLPAMLETNMYDNIVHEHNGYYGIQTMQWVMERAGLEVFDCLLNEVYGGSFRLFVKKKGCSRFPETERLRKLIDAEKTKKIFDLVTYCEFEDRIQKTRRDLRKLLEKFKKEGKSVWVYGASTKGNTILQYCEITREHAVAAADANSFKLGKYMIGADIPVKDENEMRRVRPDYLLALPYSFVDGFIKREAALVHLGTKFIVPLPEVKILP